jgi:antitoxin component of RelBE/YafQ-DinJ toxin-antitoxin module
MKQNIMMRFRVNDELREQFRSLAGEMKKTESDLIRGFMKDLCSQYEQTKRHEALSKTFAAY